MNRRGQKKNRRTIRLEQEGSEEMNWRIKEEEVYLEMR